MRTQLVTIPTETFPLDGAFHEPDGTSYRRRCCCFTATR